jgi:hypothetical protein
MDRGHLTQICDERHVQAPLSTLTLHCPIVILFAGPRGGRATNSFKSLHWLPRHAPTIIQQHSTIELLELRRELAQRHGGSFLLLYYAPGFVFSASQ